MYLKKDWFVADDSNTLDENSKIIESIQTAYSKVYNNKLKLNYHKAVNIENVFYRKRVATIVWWTEKGNLYILFRAGLSQRRRQCKLRLF